MLLRVLRACVGVGAVVRSPLCHVAVARRIRPHEDATPGTPPYRPRHARHTHTATNTTPNTHTQAKTHTSDKAPSHAQLLDNVMNNPYAMLQAAAADPSVLKHSVDRYSGVTVPQETIQEIGTAEEFATLLASSMAAWSAQGRRGLWIQIPIEQSGYAAEAAKFGFEFHHAQPRYVMLTCWLPERNHKMMAAQRAPLDGLAADGASASSPPRPASPGPEKSMIPAYASHSLGIGCLVLNSKGEVLVIQEKFAHPLLPDFWKLPGGAIDSGENISTAAEREVLEETGVSAEFRSLIGFRHLLNFRFGTGDLYFISVCTLKDESQFEPTPQPEEIAACKWWDLQEFLSFHSARWFSALIREPVLQEWAKLFPGHSLPPPPSAERVRELETMPPHPKAAEGGQWPAFSAPVPPPTGSTVGMGATRVASGLSKISSNFYIVSPTTAEVAPVSPSAKL